MTLDQVSIRLLVGLLATSMLVAVSHALNGFDIISALVLFTPTLTYVLFMYLQKDTKAGPSKKELLKQQELENPDVLGWKEEEPVAPKVIPQPVEPSIRCKGCQKEVYQQDTLFDLCKDCAYKVIENQQPI